MTLRVNLSTGVDLEYLAYPANIRENCYYENGKLKMGARGQKLLETKYKGYDYDGVLKRLQKKHAKERLSYLKH